MISGCLFIWKEMNENTKREQEEDYDTEDGVVEVNLLWLLKLVTFFPNLHWFTIVNAELQWEEWGAEGGESGGI